MVIRCVQSVLTGLPLQEKGQSLRMDVVEVGLHKCFIGLNYQKECTPNNKKTAWPRTLG